MPVSLENRYTVLPMELLFYTLLHPVSLFVCMTLPTPPPERVSSLPLSCIFSTHFSSFPFIVFAAPVSHHSSMPILLFTSSLAKPFSFSPAFIKCLACFFLLFSHRDGSMHFSAHLSLLFLTQFSSSHLFYLK